MMPSLWNAILFFIKTGCLSIGGGYAAIQMIQVQLVDVWQMMTMEDFNTLFVIAETTPGPLTINPCRLPAGRGPGGDRVYAELYFSNGADLRCPVLCLRSAAGRGSGPAGAFIPAPGGDRLDRRHHI